MSEFLSRPLKQLDRLYDIRGGQVRTRFIDLSAITLVHDVATGAQEATSRELGTQVERGSGSFDGSPAAGILCVSDNVNSVGAQDVRLEFDPWANIAAADIDLDSVEVYLTSWGGGGVTGNIDTAEDGVVVIDRQTTSLASTRHALTPLATFNGMSSVAAGGSGLGAFLLKAGSGHFPPVRLFQTDGETDKVAILFRSTGNDSWYGTTYYVITPSGISPSWI